MTQFQSYIHERAKDRNEGREPDELHLAYETELWKLRGQVTWLLARADEDARIHFRRLVGAQEEDAVDQQLQAEVKKCAHGRPELECWSAST